MLTVVTMNEASNGMPISLPLTSNVPICGTSDLSDAGLNHWFIGRNQPVLANSPTRDQSTSEASAK